MDSGCMKKLIVLLLALIPLSSFAINVDQQQRTVIEISKKISDINLKLINVYQIEQAVVAQNNQNLTNNYQNILIFAETKSMDNKSIVLNTDSNINSKTDFNINAEQVTNATIIKNGLVLVEYVSNGKNYYGYAVPTIYNMQLLIDKLFSEALVKVINLKKEYNHNQYVDITGFDVNIGISPSISITFRLK